MHCVIKRESLLKPLQLITGVVERRHTLPILSNVLLELKEGQLSLTGTDVEVELLARVDLLETGEFGSITVSARKLMDICRNLSEGSVIEFRKEEHKLVSRSGRSCFHLSTLPATDFPVSQSKPLDLEFTISQQKLRYLLESTSFAMAHQDVRYYLNGVLLEVDKNVLRLVATDAHRLALSSTELTTSGCFQVIVPRKAVFEITRLLSEGEEEATVLLSSSQLCVKTKTYTLFSKLIDGRFPDYTHVIPSGANTVMCLDRDLFKQALNRVATLVHDKYRSVVLEWRYNLLRIVSHNPEQEQAEEYIDLLYEKENFDIAFNVDYLMDALKGLSPGFIKLSLNSSEGRGGVLLENAEGYTNTYVIMPMDL